MVGYALAQAFAKNPLANRRVAIWSIRSNPTVRLSFAVDVHNNLRIAVVDRADELAPRAFQQAMISATRDARNGRGPLGAATRVLESVPVVVSQPLLRLASAVTAGLGVGVLGIPGAPFGAAMISSLQRFGMPAVDVPFVPFTRCALVCSVGSIMPAVIARGGEAVVVDTVDIRFSYDHRICDGAQLAALLDDFLVASYGPSPNA